MGKILTYAAIPTELGETPQRYLSSSNSKYYKCITFGEDIETNLCISDPECPYRYSENYYLYWNAKTNANQNRLIDSYTKYNRNMNINHQFYKIYSPYINNFPNVIVQSRVNNMYLQDLVLDYKETRSYYTYTDTGTLQLPSRSYTSQTTNKNIHSFEYTVLGDRTVRNFYPVDYWGKQNCVYDAYLIYSKPYKVLFRNNIPITFGADSDITDNLNYNTPGDQTKDVTIQNLSIDYRASIVQDCYYAQPFPIRAYYKLQDFYQSLQSPYSYGYHEKELIPFDTPVYYLYRTPSDYDSAEWIESRDAGILGIHSKLYVNSWRITPTTTTSDIGYCYTSLMYEVLNHLTSNGSSSFSYQQVGSSDFLLPLFSAYLQQNPVYEGAGTFSNQIREGTIIASDFGYSPHYYNDGSYLYRAFLKNHIDNGDMYINPTNISHIESGLNNTYCPGLRDVCYKVYTTNMKLNGTSVDTNYYTSTNFLDNLEIEDLPEAYSYMSDSEILNLYNIDVSGLNYNEKLNRILAEIKTHTFYYVEYYILVRISRLQNLINFVGNHNWGVAGHGSDSHISWRAKDDYDDYDYIISGDDGNRLIPIPLFTIAIDSNSYKKLASSPVPETLRKYNDNITPSIGLSSGIFIGNGTNIYDIKTDSSGYDQFFHASLSYSSHASSGLSSVRLVPN